MKQVLLFICCCLALLNLQAQSNKEDMAALSKLNAQFIRNFVTNDTIAHNKIIHKDFVCIDSKGKVINRKDYMLDWAHDYDTSVYKHFDYSAEFIRIFGNTALVRAVTQYTIWKDGKAINGHTIYTDTYIRENGNWQCVQAQLTPVK
jgi:hypothetical protein